MRLKDCLWPVVGVAATGFSAWLLYHELKGLSLGDMLDSLEAIPPAHWLLAAGAAVAAYAALAGYDRIALLHLRRSIPWAFIAACSFTTYALSHNIGASVLSGAVVRYRAYATRGLTASEIGVLVALCSFTFVLGAVLLGGVVLLLEPGLVERFVDDAPHGVAVAAAAAMLGLVLLYVLGSWLGLRPLRIGSVEIRYPELPIVARQLVIGPAELICAAAIIHFALPEAGHPGFLVVLGVFLASFCTALLSHAPGGLGVLEVVFLAGLPELDPADVLAALVVFRLFYLLIPFALSLVVVLLFEHSQLVRRWSARGGVGHD
jgi:hypothetical protein